MVMAACHSKNSKAHAFPEWISASRAGCEMDGFGHGDNGKLLRMGSAPTEVLVSAGDGFER